MSYRRVIGIWLILCLVFVRYLLGIYWVFAALFPMQEATNTKQIPNKV
jgi:hypothetical protein